MRPLRSPLLCLLLVLPLAGCGGGSTSIAPDAAVAEQSAGSWATWVPLAPDAVTVPPPPDPGSSRAVADRSELVRLAGHRDQQMTDTIRRWDQDPIARPWLELNAELRTGLPPDLPAAARGAALLTVGIHDAVISAWHWKYVYGQPAPTGVGGAVSPGPDPSYPSEHAVIAGVASRILGYLYPQRPAARFDDLAAEAGASRVLAGANYRSDVDAGLALGRHVAESVIARARADGADRRWDGRRPPVGPSTWTPAGPGATPPLEPEAGGWRPWVLAAGESARAPRPPAYGSPTFVADCHQLIDVSHGLTTGERSAAAFWSAGTGTATLAGIWESTALDLLGRHHLTTPRAARVLALGDIAQADATIAAWDSKYAYWSPRPANAIHDLRLDPGFAPVLPAPSYPGYVSGHAADSAAVSEVLAYLFPAETASLRTRAGEAALSREYAGVSFPSDVDAGVRVGLDVGRAVIAAARRDGAES